MGLSVNPVTNSSIATWTDIVIPAGDTFKYIYQLASENYIQPMLYTSTEGAVVTLGDVGYYNNGVMEGVCFSITNQSQIEVDVEVRILLAGDGTSDTPGDLEKVG